MTTHEQVWMQALVAAIGNDTTKTFGRCEEFADASLEAFKSRFPQNECYAKGGKIKRILSPPIAFDNPTCTVCNMFHEKQD